MRKRWFQGLIIAVACLAGTLMLLPLNAQGDMSLEILEPYAGQVVEGPRMTISVSFKSSDPNTPVVRADVYLDGVFLFGGQFSKPLPAGSFLDNRCNIAEAKPSVGQHRITVRLTDASGRICERSQMIVYQPFKSPEIRPIERNAPLVRILGPKNKAVIESPTEIRVQAVDDTALRLLEVYIDDVVRGMTNSGLYTFIWDPIGEQVMSGEHKITASAWDIFNNRGNSDPVFVYVKNSLLPEGSNPTRVQEVSWDPDPKGVPDGLVVVPGQVLNLSNRSLAYVPLTRAVLPAWEGGSNVILPALPSPQAQAYVLPALTLGTLAVTPDVAQPAFDATGSAALAGLLGSLGAARPASPLAPPSALIAPTPSLSVAPVATPAAGGQPAVPSLSAGPAGQGVATTLPALAVMPATLNLTSPAARALPEVSAPAAELQTIGSLRLVTPRAGSQVIGSPSLMLSGSAEQVRQFIQLPAAEREQLYVSPTLIALVPTAASLSAPAPTVSTPSELTAVETSLPATQSVLTIPTAQSQPAAAPTHISPALVPDGGPSVPAGARAGASRTPQLAAVPGSPLTSPTAAAVSAPARDGAVPTRMLDPVKPATAPDKPVAPSIKTTPPTTRPTAPAAAGTNPLAGLKSRYTVMPGDSLETIARAFGTTKAALLRMNPGVDGEKLASGTTITVPRRGVQVVLDDVDFQTSPAPYVAGKGYVMVPMRALVQAKGGVVMWLPDTREVNAWVNNNFLAVAIGKRTAKINETVYVLPVAATIHDSRAIVPIRFLVQGMGLQAAYDPAKKSVTVSEK